MRLGRATVALFGALCSGCNLVAGIGEPEDRVDAGLADGGPSLQDETPREADAPGEGFADGADDERFVEASVIDGSVVDVNPDAFVDASGDRGSDAPTDRTVVPPGEGGSGTIEFQGSWFGSDRNV